MGHIRAQFLRASACDPWARALGHHIHGPTILSHFSLLPQYVRAGSSIQSVLLCAALSRYSHKRSEKGHTYAHLFACREGPDVIEHVDPWAITIAVVCAPLATVA